MGQFDTDAVALEARIDAHERYGSRDLNAWLFSLLDVSPAQAILDLGCGTGKQTIPLAEIVGRAGMVWGVDISAEALKRLKQQRYKVWARIELFEEGMDTLNSWQLPSKHFDRALAAFSLYYARDPGKVMETVRDALKSGGIFVFCGPAEGNNAELKALLPIMGNDAVVKFMENEGPRMARDVFKQADIMRFENPLTFPTAEALIAYWQAGNLYDEWLAEGFQTEAEMHFRKYGQFVTTKRVLAVRAVR